MNQLFASFSAGMIFAIGLGISGMTNANKVIGFLNLAGYWDPSLAFVMVGAIAIHLALYRWAIRQPSPLYSQQFMVPTRQDINAPLVAGSAMFGVGWGLGGFCPGPGLTSLMTSSPAAWVFVGCMFGGMLLHTLTLGAAVPSTPVAQARR